MKITLQCLQCRLYYDAIKVVKYVFREEEQSPFGSLLVKFIEKILHRFDASKCEGLVEE